MVETLGSLGEDPWSGTSAQTLDTELQSRLRNVQLVCELNLELDGEVFGKAQSVLNRNWHRLVPDNLSTTYPAALVIFLVAYGVYSYKEGTFWQHLPIEGIEQQRIQARLGQSFLESLESLGLETFEDDLEGDKSLRYVSPILLHGGIPGYCANDLWERIVDAIKIGDDDADQLVGRWRRDPTKLTGLDKPAQRFIRFGGDFAVDLIQRMINLAVDVGERGQESTGGLDYEQLANEWGLPTYFAATLTDSPDLGSRRGGSRLPRPSIRIDAYSGEGPFAELPPVPGRKGIWLVRGKNSVQHRTSAHETVIVPLEPAARWEIHLKVEDQERLFEFSGMDGARVYFFDLGGTLARNQQHLRGKEVIALAPRNLQFVTKSSPTNRIREIYEELPSIGGSWSTYEIHALDLDGLDSMRIVADPVPGSEAIDESVRISSSVLRPEIVTEPVNGVTTIDGGNVYSSCPVLQLDLGKTDPSAWRVRFRGDDRKVLEAGAMSDLSTGEGKFALARLLPHDGSISGELEVIGPLGSDFKQSVTIVPGLRFDLPERVIGPREEIEVAVSADLPVDKTGAKTVTLRFPTDCDSQEHVIVGNIPLVFTVPRLMWIIRRRGMQMRAFSNEIQAVALDDFVDGIIEAIHVRLRCAETMRLELHDGDNCLQVSNSTRGGGKDFSWVFDLSEFVTTAEQAGISHLYLRVVTDTARVDVLRIDAEYIVTIIGVESEIEGSETLCEVRWTENRRFKRREIRFWSRHRPWAEPVRERVPETAEDRWDFLSDELPPGPYLLEIGIGDDWTPPPRPAASSANTALIQIGSDYEHRQRLKNLADDEPRSLVELILAEEVSAADLPESIPVDSSVFGSALVALLRDNGARAVSQPLFRDLLTIWLGQPESLVSWILESPDLADSRTEQLRLLIALLPDVLEAVQGNYERPWAQRLWLFNVVAGALFDRYCSGDVEVANRWRHHTGWNPQWAENSPCRGGVVLKSDDYEGSLRPEEEDGLPKRCETISDPLDALEPEKLRTLAETIRPVETRPLRWSGHLDAMIDFLLSTWNRRDIIDKWRSSHFRLIAMSWQLGDLANGYLRKLEPADNLPKWCRFPGEVQAAAFYLVSAKAFREDATRALWDAIEIAPSLVERSLLVAVTIECL